MHNCIRILLLSAYQSNKDTEQLDHIRISDRVESSEQRVRDSDASRSHDGMRVVDLDDHRKSGTYEQS